MQQQQLRDPHVHASLPRASCDLLLSFRSPLSRAWQWQRQVGLTRENTTTHGPEQSQSILCVFQEFEDLLGVAKSASWHLLTRRQRTCSFKKISNIFLDHFIIKNKPPNPRFQYVKTLVTTIQYVELKSQEQQN